MADEPLPIDPLCAVEMANHACTGTPVRVGQRVAGWDLRVADHGGDPVAVATLTVSIRDP